MTHEHEGTHDTHDATCEREGCAEDYTTIWQSGRHVEFLCDTHADERACA